MGHAQRTKRRLVGMMQQATFVNRLRVWWAFVGQASRPNKIRGLAGARWVLTGEVEQARRRP
jgi:hypothetical protein